ncbi:metallophosphoesterase [Mesorhizobium sp. M1322]|uniref:metallophosphoesterase family protein n=1 Tax=Mesorhizobium sp. M1322 TaxID=2957081 RepID=UPI0033369001
MSSRPIKNVFKRIYQIIASESVDAVLFMGDFTDYGKLPGFDACCKYIAGALQLGKNNIFEQMPTGIVPGNHDIDRALAGNAGTAKFSTLSKALATHGLPNIPVNLPTRMDLRQAGLGSSVYLLNSCWGCGEKLYIPAEFGDAINAAIDAVIGGPGGERALSAYYNRQLDTPAFSDSTIASVVEAISECPADDMPIIVAHHNLLPQRLPRLAPYTELVNSGALRSSLMELDRPVLYLHGHIHEEPVETLHAPGNAPLVIVSAPLITKGFNVIEIVFAPGSVPIVCNVLPYRFDGSGVLRKFPEMKVPLTGKRRRGTFPTKNSLYSKLIEKRTSYWSEILAFFPDTLQRPSDEELIQLLELLLAEGLVEIDNYELPYQAWIARAEV